MQISDNFSVEEFDCGTHPYPPEWIEKRLKPLVDSLEKIRALTGQPMVINSGYRTPEHNAAVGGAKASIHMQGLAADIVLHGMTIPQLHSAIEALIKNGTIPEGGLGLYDRFIHYDHRGHKARWDCSTWNNK